MTEKLESRAELMQRISQPAGHSKADQEDHIALLIVQMMKDIKSIREASTELIRAIHGLKGIEKIFGMKARLKDLDRCTNEGLRALEIGCGSILNLTKNKTNTLTTERKFSVHERRNEQRSMIKSVGLAKLKKIRPPPHATTSALTKTNISRLLGHVQEIIARRNLSNPIDNTKRINTHPLYTRDTRLAKSTSINYGASVTLVQGLGSALAVMLSRHVAMILDMYYYHEVNWQMTKIMM